MRLCRFDSCSIKDVESLMGSVEFIKDNSIIHYRYTVCLSYRNTLDCILMAYNKTILTTTEFFKVACQQLPLS